MGLPRVEIHRKGREFQKILKGIIMASVISGCLYLLFALGLVVQAGCEEDTVMTKGQAQAKSSRILKQAVPECWGDGLGWQCKGEHGGWTVCTDGDCVKVELVK